MHLQNTTSQRGDETLERKPMTKLLHAASQKKKKKTGLHKTHLQKQGKAENTLAKQGFTSVPIAVRAAVFSAIKITLCSG